MPEIRGQGINGHHLDLHKLISGQDTGFRGDSISHKTSYRKISQSLEDAKLVIRVPHCSEIWQATRQHCCRGACQISKWYEHFNTRSRGFETLWGLTLRRLIRYWIGLQVTVRMDPCMYFPLCMWNVAAPAQCHMKVPYHNNNIPGHGRTRLRVP